MVGAAIVAVGGIVIRRTTGELGTALAPFVAGWGPRADALWLPLAVAVLAAAVAWAPRLLDARVPSWAFAPASALLWLGAGLAVNAAREGPPAWWRVFDLGPGGSFEAPNEYLPGLPTLSYGVRVYLDRFAEFIPSQPVNVAGHPPGPLLLMHWLGIDSAGAQATLCIALGALCPPLAYAIGRTLHDEPAARTAALLAAASPVALLFGVTSYDIAFAAFGALAAWLLVLPRGAVALAAGAAALAVAAFMSWALLGVGAWSAIVVWRRDGRRRAIVLASACAAALVALNAGLALAYGYDALGALQSTEQVYRDSIAMRRPYWFWVLGSPVAWGLMLGPPIAALALRALVRAQPTAVATAFVIAVAAGGGFTKAETERIWLFLVPLVCVAAGPELARSRLRIVLAALAAQALVASVLVGTVW
jgi:hypothetical protein